MLFIILVPVILVQLITVLIFYERHWEDVGRRLVLGLGGQIAFLISELESQPSQKEKLFTNKLASF